MATIRMITNSVSMDASSASCAEPGTDADRLQAWTFVDLTADAPGTDPEAPRVWPMSSRWCGCRLPGGLVEPRVGVPGVVTRCLGQDANDGRQQEGEEEFHARILRSGVDNSNPMWFDKKS